MVYHRVEEACMRSEFASRGKQVVEHEVSTTIANAIAKKKQEKVSSKR